LLLLLWLLLLLLLMFYCGFDNVLDDSSRQAYAGNRRELEEISKQKHTDTAKRQLIQACQRTQSQMRSHKHGRANGRDFVHHHQRKPVGRMVARD
jgi:beta-phosphoglucomutase-like phosphatase (HAD superfamily)